MSILQIPPVFVLCCSIFFDVVVIDVGIRVLFHRVLLQVDVVDVIVDVDAAQRLGRVEARPVHIFY